MIGYENRIPHMLTLPLVCDQGENPFLSFTNNLCVGPILLSLYLILLFSLSLSLSLPCFDLITTWIAAATLCIHNKLLNTFILGAQSYITTFEYILVWHSVVYSWVQSYHAMLIAHCMSREGTFHNKNLGTSQVKGNFEWFFGYLKFTSCHGFRIGKK